MVLDYILDNILYDLYIANYLFVMNQTESVVTAVLQPTKLIYNINKIT